MDPINRNFDPTPLFASTVICTCTWLPRHHIGGHGGSFWSCRLQWESSGSSSIYLSLSNFLIHRVTAIHLYWSAEHEVNSPCVAWFGGRWQCALHNPAVMCCSQGSHLAVSCKKPMGMRGTKQFAHQFSYFWTYLFCCFLLLLGWSTRLELSR